MGKSKRLIDIKAVRQKLADLHMKQLEILMERLEEGLIEPQEMRLIWDMVKTHSIGIETVDDMVSTALKKAEEQLGEDNLDLDDEWSYTQP